MRKLIIALLAAAAVAACSGIPIGPVDHSCRNATCDPPIREVSPSR
jgi:hypothetical protein